MTNIDGLIIQPLINGDLFSLLNRMTFRMENEGKAKVDYVKMSMGIK